MDLTGSWITGTVSCSMRIQHPAGAPHRPPLPDTAAARLRAAYDAMTYADVARETDPVALSVGTAAAAEGDTAIAAAAAVTTAGEAAAVGDDAAAAAAAVAAAAEDDTRAAAVAFSGTTAEAATTAPWAATMAQTAAGTRFRAATMAQTAAGTGFRDTTQIIVRMAEESELTDPRTMYDCSVTPLQSRTGNRSIRRP